MNPTQLTDALRQQFDLTNYGQQPPELYDPIRYIMGLGGKRLRPLMTLLAASLFTDDYTLALKPAVAVEVFHNFTLLHDDIMDQAPLRRGMPTVHEKWNANIAILSGDVMLVKAYEQLLDIDAQHLRQALQRFSQTAAEVCEGQQMDMNFESRDTVSEAEYIEMIRLKTSVLLGLAMELGGLVAGADAESTQHLYDGGLNIGIGFQLKDDLLDVYGDPAKFGKQVGGDIIANKKTFLLIEALERAEGTVRTELLDWLGRDTFDKAEKVAAITAIYDQLGIRTLTEARIADYFQKGFANLDQVNADPVRKATLLDFAHQLVERES
ncbi:polyprenyl synthetase family protein [Fibrella sp. HMF5335]|uniref:Polyprenyl synthetase family protein n=1 Tax=Fibrella rubiginis TaxID=2817060 RepID=A0A939K1E7_9BACT|nr:polyprenyl synthetase family protein [Fibrella rubiginis]MBO0935169.1 polyprenyl synthetase family protein [Fibrella rubiginis]